MHDIKRQFCLGFIGEMTRSNTNSGVSRQKLVSSSSERATRYSCPGGAAAIPPLVGPLASAVLVDFRGLWICFGRNRTAREAVLRRFGRQLDHRCVGAARLSNHFGDDEIGQSQFFRRQFVQIFPFGNLRSSSAMPACAAPSSIGTKPGNAMQREAAPSSIQLRLPPNECERRLDRRCGLRARRQTITPVS